MYDLKCKNQNVLINWTSYFSSLKSTQHHTVASVLLLTSHEHDSRTKFRTKYLPVKLQVSFFIVFMLATDLLMGTVVMVEHTSSKCSDMLVS